MWSLLSGHISRLVEKIIAVPLTDFCNFFLQLSLSERVTKSVTLYKWLSCINMEFKNHYKKLNDIRRSQTHNLLLIKHFKPFSLWKGQSNSYLNQKREVFLAKYLIQNQQLRIGFWTDCLTTAWWLLDHCLMIFWPLSDVCLTTGTACWLLTFIMIENCIVAAWIRKKIAKYMWKGCKDTNMYKYDTILCSTQCVL